MNALSMTGTFSKAPRAWGFEDDIRVVQGDNQFVVLSDGKRYLDWVCGLGSNLLGYSNVEYGKRVAQQVLLGAGFSLPHYLEDIVAEKLVNILATRVPGWNYDDFSVRFAKTGSDAASIAVRLARAVTGRRVIWHCGYSGWGVEFMAAVSPAHGIPVDYKRVVETFNFNDEGSVLKLRDHGDLAAIVIEQGIENPHPEWYALLRKIANDTGALLIIDEVVTGLRFDLGGACEVMNIWPDIVIMGKALGNGLPISAVVGRTEYMDWFKRDDPVFCSSTHWGEAVSLSAANAVLDIFTDKSAKELWRIGNGLMTGLNQAGWKTKGHGPRSVLFFDDDYERAFFIHGMRAKGILMNRPNFVNAAHTMDDVRNTVDAAALVKEEWEHCDKVAVRKALENKLPHILFKNR